MPLSKKNNTDKEDVCKDLNKLMYVDSFVFTLNDVKCNLTLPTIYILIIYNFIKMLLVGFSCAICRTIYQ